MKPYYQDSAVTIYHGDCREIWPRLNPMFFPVLTDPPYGNKTEYASFADSESGLHNLITEIRQPLAISLRAFISCGVSNIHLWPKPDWTLAWFTPAGAGSGKWGFCCWQPVLAYGPDPYLQLGLGRRPDAIVRTETSEKNGHPCPKPISLWEWMLERLSPNKDETVLDPFMGSGTTLRAAKDLGRKAIGIEIEEKYCEIAAKRMAQEVLGLESVCPQRVEQVYELPLIPKEVRLSESA